MTLRERGVEAAERCVPSLLSQPEFNRPLYQTWRIQSTRTSRPHLQKHYTASNRVHMYDMLSSLGMHARWTCVCSPPVCFRSAPLSIAPRRRIISSRWLAWSVGRADISPLEHNKFQGTPTLFQDNAVLAIARLCFRNKMLVSALIGCA
ncbi:hypothetical protein IG631_03880 [Alternaria alternata]|nr:hypothetical protein IG631_03880 [Alternaria alternata]